ncbi:MAG: hypothetical protein Q8N26_36620 [Myxococcales bacterium]|nr:hypothetical protein [Myxococcales bacterium]
MKIVGIEGLSAAQLRDEVDRGGRFVVYGWCVSFIILTLKRSSDITFVRAEQSRVGAGLGWTVLSLFLGWWGFPFGLIYTPMVLIQNLGGGTDVTPSVMASLEAELGPRASPGSVHPPDASSPQRAAPVPVFGPPTAPVNRSSASGPSSRDLGAVVMATLSLACCAPLGWVAAVLAIISIREARAASRSTPVLSIVTLVMSSLSTLLLVVGGAALAVDMVKTGNLRREALTRAAPGRLQATLDVKTACSLAEASLRDGLVKSRTSWDIIRCDPSLSDDDSTPSLDLTTENSKKTERYTACFARSNRRWFVLTVRPSPGCPAAPELLVPLTATEKELEKEERAAQRAAQHAPVARSGPLVQPRFEGDADDDWPRLDLVVTNVATKQQPGDKPPFHTPGGDWTYFDLALAADPTAKVRLGMKAPKATDSPFSFSELRLSPLDRASSTRFVAAVAKAFLVPVPAVAPKPKKLVPVKLATAVLGQGMVREGAGGGFSVPAKGETPGTWTTTKVFFEKDAQYAEVFFNVDLEAGVAEFSEKDADYRDGLLALLSRALLDGW